MYHTYLLGVCQGKSRQHVATSAHTKTDYILEDEVCHNKTDLLCQLVHCGIDVTVDKRNTAFMSTCCYWPYTSTCSHYDHQLWSDMKMAYRHTSVFTKDRLTFQRWSQIRSRNATHVFICTQSRRTDFGIPRKIVSPVPIFPFFTLREESTYSDVACMFSASSFFICDTHCALTPCLHSHMSSKKPLSPPHARGVARLHR